MVKSEPTIDGVHGSIELGAGKIVACELEGGNARVRRVGEADGRRNAVCQISDDEGIVWVDDDATVSKSCDAEGIGTGVIAE